MQIYIPEYLRQRIPVLQQLYEVISEYGKMYPEQADDSYSDYRYSLRNDAVIRFLDYVVPGIEDYRLRFPGITDEELETLRLENIKYLTALMYSVKGTYKVLDYLTEYDLFQTSSGKDIQTPDTTTKVTYTKKSISISISSLPNSFDRDLFCEYLEKFLSALLYFESLTIIIDTISTKISDSTTTSLNHGEAFYQSYTVDAKKITL